MIADPVDPSDCTDAAEGVGAEDSAPEAEEFRQAMRLMFAAVVTYSQAVADRVGMSATDVHCINVLALSGPITAGKLGAFTGITSGAVTRLIDRLVASGYVVRRHDPKDRRRVIVERTNTPAQIGGFFKPLAKRLRPVMAAMSEHDRAVVLQFLTACTPAIREAAVDLRQSCSRSAADGDGLTGGLEN